MYATPGPWTLSGSHEIYTLLLNSVLWSVFTGFIDVRNTSKMSKSLLLNSTDLVNTVRGTLSMMRHKLGTASIE